MRKHLITIGKWHFKLGIVPVYWSHHTYLLHFGIFKLLTHPPEGELITKANYKGFWLRKEFIIHGFEISL